MFILGTVLDCCPCVSLEVWILGGAIMRSGRKMSVNVLPSWSLSPGAGSEHASFAFKQKRTFEPGLFSRASDQIAAVSSSMIGGANCRRWMITWQIW